MQMKDVRYVPYSPVWFQEKVDDITRYLKLSSEFGCGEEGARIFENFKEDILKRISEFESLVLAQKDAEEPDDLESIRRLRPAGPRKMTGEIRAIGRAHV